MASLSPYAGPLTEKQAAHLLRRCTFGPTIGQINDFTALTPATAVNNLFADSPDPNPPIDLKTTSTWVLPGQNKAVEGTNSEQDTLFDYYKAWHTDVMLKSGTSIKERLTWFYHTHLPARWTEIRSSEAIYYQNCIFRYYAYGSFKELFKKICIDNAMLVYLDGFTNHKDEPNENFAREMFELYSIGKGPQLEDGDYTHYTETDIKEATKVLTGWLFDEDFDNIDDDCGWPIGKMLMDATEVQALGHEDGTKTFTDKFGSVTISPSATSGGYPTVAAAHQELDEMIEMIFNQEETARFIIRKLYRFFVYHFISDEVEQDIIRPLATELKDTHNYQIDLALKTLLTSEHFYDIDTPGVTSDNNIGAVIKSPIDLTLGLLRFFEIETPDRETEASSFYQDIIEGVIPRFVAQGLNYYEPFEVAGYPAYHQVPAYARNWIMHYELARRYEIGEFFMKKTSESDSISFKLDILDWVKNSGFISEPTDSAEIVTVLTTYMLAVEIDQDRFDYFLDTVFRDDLPATSWINMWNAYDAGGSETDVRNTLERFLSKLIQTPEYQLL